MGKHKGKKKNLKKRVHKRAQKIKGLTAQDLLMNPALLQSPQFKALPLEKQFQLTSQLKQLRMLATRPMNGLGAVSSSNADSLYSKYLDSNSKLSQAQYETQRLKQQIEENERQRKDEIKLQNDLKDKEQMYKKQMKHKNAVRDYQRQMDKLDEQFNIEQINDLKTRAAELLGTQEQIKAQKRSEEWQKQRDKFTALVAEKAGLDLDKAQEYFEMASIENQKKTNQGMAKLTKNQEELNNMNERRFVLQTVSNAYNDNGYSEQEDLTEREIADMNELIEKKKQPDITENNDDEETYEEQQEEQQEEVQDNSFTPDESLEQQNINLEAQKMILKDKIALEEEELKSKQQLQQEEERAEMTNRINEQLLRIQQHNKRKEYIKEFNTTQDEIKKNITEAKNLENSTTLKPYVVEVQNKLRYFANQYSTLKSGENKLKLIVEMNQLNDEMKQKLDEWKSQQATVAKQAQHLEDLQIQNGIQPNLNYRTRLTEEANKSSPTKNTAILAKIQNDTKQVEDGINELKEVKTLRKAAYDLTNQLQQNLIKNKARNPANICYAWKFIIQNVKDSKPKLQYIVNDLKEESKKAELNQKITQIKAFDYLKKLEGFNEDKINVAQFDQQEPLFDGDDSWINEIKPNDRFSFELKDIKIDPNAQTSQVFESVIKRILKEGAKWSWNHKWTRYLMIGAGAVLAVRFMPGETGKVFGNIAGTLSVGIGKILGKQAHQIPDFSKGFYQSVRPGLEQAKETLKPIVQTGLNYANQNLQQAYNQFAATEGGKLTIEMLNDAKDLGYHGLKAGVSALKATERITHSGAPIVEKGLDVINFVLDKGGRLISWGINGVNCALDWGKLGATRVADYLSSAFKRNQ